MKKFLTIISVFLCYIAQAQTTTGSISGDVLDTEGTQLVGAKVTAIHEPTGTEYVSKVRQNGEFNIPNLIVGGPYTVTASMAGMQEVSESDVYVGLGADYRVNLIMGDDPTQLEEVSVVGEYDIYNGSHQGVETNINLNAINALPTAGRELQDFLRTVPQAKLDDRGGISIAGQNNRFNQIMIDGAVNNDVFGLAASGTNGGQTGFSPISMDAVQSFQVNVSPYDVSQGNFTGGAINAVTRRGGNNVEASAYYFLRNHSLSGKTPIFGPNDDRDRESFKPFATNTFGARIGGAFKKNKSFYFINLERIEANVPQPFDIGTYQGASSAADLNNLIQHVKQNYGYDVGGYEDNVENNTSTRLVSRFDFNLNPKNKLALTYRYTNSNAINISRSSANVINFSNGGYEFPSTTHSGTMEWNHASENNRFNKLQVGFTSVTDDRGPRGGNPFPYVSINDGASGTINFGTEQYSTANKLQQQNFFLFDKYNIYKGKNSIYFGVDLEYSQTYNLFIRQSFGSYQYDNIQNFLNNDTIARYDRTYSILDGDVSVDGSNAAADFSTLRSGFFVGDDIKFNDKFTLTVGARLDYLQFLTEQRSESFFNDTALMVFNQYYDLEGAKLGGRPKGLLNFSPRLGFNYQLEDGIQLRGGAGVFTGRIPLVWPGAIYQYTGNQLGSIRESDITDFGFDPDVNRQYTQADVGGTDDVPSGEIDLLSPKFKLPQVFKGSLGADFKLPGGVNANLDFLYTQNLTEIKYVNFGLDPTTVTLDDVGGITRYTNGNIKDLNSFEAGDQNPYGNNNRFMLITNNEGKKGSAMNITLGLNKRFSEYATIGANLTYGTSKVSLDGTSSQNSSQWRYMESATGRNNLPISYSDFDLGNRYNVFAAFKLPYSSETFSTKLSFFFNAQSGRRYSFTYTTPRGTNPITNDNSTYNVDLMYIPDNASDINLVSYTDNSGATVTAAEQWAALDGFISNNKYLSSHRGMMSERNGARTPMSAVLDMKLVQDIYVGNKNTLQFTFDMFNFTNFLSRNWGQVYYVSNDNFQAVQFEGLDANGKAEFTFRGKANDRPYNLVDNSQFNPSRWVAQFGVRYIFK